jgi:hypothetical protein
MQNTTSTQYRQLAQQLYTGAKDAPEADREQMIAAAQRYEQLAGEQEVREMAEDTERRAFWASRDMNWVS